MLPEFSFPTVTYGIAFSFSLAMDKFVIGRVVTAIDYPSIKVFIVKISLCFQLVVTRAASADRARR
jgi:hypothetical protein